MKASRRLFHGETHNLGVQTKLYLNNTTTTEIPQTTTKTQTSIWQYDETKSPESAPLKLAPYQKMSHHHRRLLLHSNPPHRLLTHRFLRHRPNRVNKIEKDMVNIQEKRHALLFVWIHKNKEIRPHLFELKRTATFDFIWLRLQKKTRFTPICLKSQEKWRGTSWPAW